jgi:hypothetical protein
MECRDSGENFIPTRILLSSSLKIDTSPDARIDRGMLAQRRPGSGGATGLDSDNIRNLLRTTRAILNERSAAERAPPFNDGLSRILPLPEYIYVWFASNHKGAQSTGAMRGVMADAECGRFLDTLERYRDKSKELAAFWYLGEIKSNYPKLSFPVSLFSIECALPQQQQQQQQQQ